MTVIPSLQFAKLIFALMHVTLKLVT